MNAILYSSIDWFTKKIVIFNINFCKIIKIVSKLLSVTIKIQAMRGNGLLAFLILFFIINKTNKSNNAIHSGRDGGDSVQP